MSEKLSPVLSDTMAYLDQTLHTDKNFDLISKTIQAADRAACIYFVDGFIKDDIMEKLLEFLYGLTPEDLPEDSEGLSCEFMPYVEVELLADCQEVVDSLLSGVLCLFIDGYSRCFAIDCRTYPMRGVEEPEKDKVLRGSRDGFVETIVFNTALIRRRIRQTGLSMEMMSIGKTSKTDVVLCYMEGRADQEFLEKIRRRLQNVEVDALTMNQESLAECLYRKKWWNPFPKFKYTERPDTAAASILDGKIVILVDTSPSAMILPVSIFDLLEDADDFYFPPITGTYLRLSRFIIAVMTLVLTPIWLLFMQNTQWIPDWLLFILPGDKVYVPLVVQLLILEFSIDGLRLAAVNTPNTLSTSLSVIAGIVVGEFAVNSHWFNSETMLYMAFVAIANYTQSSFELGYAFKFMRILMLILTALFNLYGLIGGLALTVLFLLLNKTVSGQCYLYPLIPFNGKELSRRLLRKRIQFQNKNENIV